MAFRSPAGPSVRVVCESDATAQWLREMLTPWFDLVQPRPDTPTVRVYESPRAEGPPGGSVTTAPCFALDRTVETAPARTVKGSVLIDHDAIGASYDITASEVVVRPYGPRPTARLGAFLVVRELLIARMPAGVHVQLHASAMRFGGDVIVMTGPAGSGKTTTLAHLAGSVGAGIVANDRTLVHPEGGSWQALGVPTIVGLRAGTLAALPHLLGAIASRGRTIHLTVTEAERAPASSRERVPGRHLAVSLAQLARRLAVPLVAGGRIGCIVMLVVDHDVHAFALRRLAPPEAGPRLLALRFGAATEPRPPTVFETWVGRHPGPVDDVTRLDALVRTTACAEVRVGPGLLAGEQAATDLLSALAALAAVR